MSSFGNGPVEFKVTGVEAIQRKLATMARVVPQKLAKGLHREANYAKTITNQRFVPKDFSVLADSGTVEEAKVTKEEISVLIYYGGAAAPYAAAIHEFPESPPAPRSWRGKGVGDILSVRNREPWSLTGRGPKYLERGLKEILPGLGARLVKDLEQALLSTGGGG